MSSCGQEMCEFWNGSRCVCAVMDIEEEDRPIVCGTCGMKGGPGRGSGGLSGCPECGFCY